MTLSCVNLSFSVCVGGSSHLRAAHQRLIQRCSTRFARTRTVSVQANELNKWGDISGPEEGSGLYDDAFEKDTARVLGRVLTARAVQLTLQQLSDTDLFVMQWLNNFSAENSPMKDDFLVLLLSQAPHSVVDKTNNVTHKIVPSDVVTRIMTVRKDMAGKAAQYLERGVQESSMDVLREHLMRTSYTSGESDGEGDKGKNRRRSRR